MPENDPLAYLNPNSGTNFGSASQNITAGLNAQAGFEDPTAPGKSVTRKGVTKGATGDLPLNDTGLEITNAGGYIPLTKGVDPTVDRPLYDHRRAQAAGRQASESRFADKRQATADKLARVAKGKADARFANTVNKQNINLSADQQQANIKAAIAGRAGGAGAAGGATGGAGDLASQYVAQNQGAAANIVAGLQRMLGGG